MKQDSRRRVSIDDLLEEGLELYGRNLVAEAIQCWREALALAPEDRRAVDYLDAAGVPAPPPPAAPTAQIIELYPGRSERRITPAPIPVPVRQAPPAGGDPGVGYAERLDRAMEAYLAGELAEALRLYEACVAERPADPLARHNLGKLRERMARRGSP